MKFRRDVTDPATGLANDALTKAVQRLAAELADKEPWPVVKAKLYAFICDNMAIDVSPRDWFPAITCWNRHARPIAPVLRARNRTIDLQRCPDNLKRREAGNRDGRWMMWRDYDHSVPDWNEILPLGFTGLRDRLAARAVDGPRAEAWRVTAEASLRWIARFAEQAARNLARQPDGVARLRKQVAALRQLTVGAPRTTYEVMMFTWMYFFLSEHVDHLQVRSLGDIDRLWRPYYEADLAAGRTTEAEFREQFASFLWQWGSIDNYWGQPIWLGGTSATGATEYNALSRILLDVIDTEGLPTPKFQLKIAANTPRDILDTAFKMIRRHRPLVLCGEESMARVMKHYGYSDEEARTLTIRGCYEFVPRKGANSTGPGYLNLVKPLEDLLKEALTKSDVYADFPAFLAAFRARLRQNATDCREVAFELEKHLADINAANLFSLATRNSLDTGRDAFANGTVNGNNTSILCAGLGTAVDALLAVKELVYEKHEFTLRGLAEVMSADWQGHEALRLRMLRSKRKWGNNDPEANALGRAVADAFTGAINRVPNSRGGFFTASGHSARQFLTFGAKLGATPDGRRKGDEISKNLSPVMGADTEGVTALVSSHAALDARAWPGDFILDVMLHPSAVAGEKGLDAMHALVRQYFANGGCAIHFNVFSVEELRDAQAHPEKYENLQVRVCGWNVRWNDLPRTEQDAYIRRAESMNF